MKKLYLPLILIIVTYTVFYMAGIGCPIKFLTGISCAGCGMTRAYLSILRLDFASAFHYHPLWPLAPFLLALVIFHNRIAPRLRNTLFVLFITAFLAVYICRLFSANNTIVTVDTEHGFIVQLIKSLWSFFYEQIHTK